VLLIFYSLILLLVGAIRWVVTFPPYLQGFDMHPGFISLQTEIITIILLMMVVPEDTQMYAVLCAIPFVIGSIGIMGYDAVKRKVVCL